MARDSMPNIHSRAPELASAHLNHLPESLRQDLTSPAAQITETTNIDRLEGPEKPPRRTRPALEAEL